MPRQEQQQRGCHATKNTEVTPASPRDETVSTSTITHNDSALIPPDNDLALVQNAKEGSLTAFGELVKPHERQMFRIAHNLLHNREDAEDAVQVALLKAFQKLLQFQAKAKFSTWLGRITFNEALTKLRRDPVRRNSIGHNCPDEAGPLSAGNCGLGSKSRDALYRKRTSQYSRVEPVPTQP